MSAQARAASDWRRRWFCLAVVVMTAVVLDVRPVAAQTCVGDCTGQDKVDISDLVIGVNIALGIQPVTACQAFANADGTVDIAQLIQGVNYALNGCAATPTPTGPTITLTGSCAAPGTSSQNHGLKVCDVGTQITVFRCDDRTQCLHQQVLHKVGMTTISKLDGSWSVQVLTADASATLVFQASNETDLVYRALGFGYVGGLLRAGLDRAASFAPVAIQPATEATVQLLDNNGFQNYSDSGAQQVANAVEQATASLSFQGDTPEMAVAVALQAASADSTVVMVLQAARNTPTPAPSPTVTLTPTMTRSPTVMVSPTVTLSPTRTFTATPTLTPTVTATSSPMPTPLPTVAGCTTMVGGQIDTATTWTAAGSPYCLTADVVVTGAGLVIQPGVQVAFQGDYVFEVDSTLQAMGTDLAPIVFTKGAGLAGTVGKGVFLNNAQAATVLQHVRFEYLNAGGLQIVNSYPTIESCTITNNQITGNGGGLRVSLATPGELVIKNSHIDSNAATGQGGGIYADLSSGALTLDHSTVDNNRANSQGATGIYYGGGIYASASGGLTLKHSELSGNHTSSYCTNCTSTAFGGGLYLLSGSVQMETSTITSNTAAAGCGGNCGAYAYGGGVYASAGAVEVDNSVLRNNADQGTSSIRGSGIYIDHAAVSLVNATVAYNDAGVYNAAGVLQVRNSIVYANAGAQIQGTATVNYSDVQGGFTTGTGNIDQDPQFVSVSDLHLDCPYSPCAAMGDPAMRYYNGCMPPACGTMQNDMGAFGGPNDCNWPQ